MPDRNRNHIGNHIPSLSASLRAKASRGKEASLGEVEDRFRQIMQGPLSRAAEMGQADIVVGIPFYNESDTINLVLETARRGLEEYYPGQKSVIVAAGSPAGGEALEMINRFPQDNKVHILAFLLDDERTIGKGWNVRAIMEIARTLSADLVVLEADLRSRRRNGEIYGLAPDWIQRLIEPIKRENADLAISRFNRHYFGDPISSLLTYPLLTAVYNRPVHHLVGGQWGISHRLIRTYLQGPHYPWSPKICGYGIDSWLVSRAIVNGARIFEANLGIKIHHKPSPAKRALVLLQVAEVLCDQIVADRQWWEEESKKAVIRELPVLRPLATLGEKRSHQPDEVQVDYQQLAGKYKQGFNKFHYLYEKTLPVEAYQKLEKLAETEGDSFDFPAKLWVQVVYHLLLACAFAKEFVRDDLLNSLVPLHSGFMHGFARKIQLLKDELKSLPDEEAGQLVTLKAEKELEGLVDEFLRQKPHLMAEWRERAEALKPPVPQITYREFIPGVPLVVPTELTTLEGKVVRANDIYDSIFARQKTDFEHFVYERLQISREASSQEIALQIEDFWHSVEGRILPSSDLSTIEGTREMVQFLFDDFPRREAFSLIPEMAYRFLWQYPPSTLYTRLGYSDLAEMLQEYDPLDILALANWSEDREYVEGLRKLIGENIRSEHFAHLALKPLVVRHMDFPSLVEMKDSSALDKLCSRVVVSNLHKGMGGEFPKLRYMTTIAKNIVEAERFGEVWQRFAGERKDFGRKVIDSLQGHWGREPLSAHSLFEDGNQRALAERFRQMAERITWEANGDTARLNLAERIKDVADSYHLVLTLSDGTFITCSAWSWASYSFKGGRALPPPLSLHVERDWTSREFLVEYFKAAGGSEEAVEEKIIELMGQGREWEDLAPIILGTEKGAEEVVSKAAIVPVPAQPPAGILKRFAANPVLEPVKEHPWESKYVFNAGTIMLNGRVYMVYRAFGEDEVSRLGLAASEDGFKFTERLEEPIFEPKSKSEVKGCEDPRLTLIDDRVYMAYTAYDGIVAQIALASISIQDFLDYRWKNWHRHGLVFPGFNDKDAALFPELFNGKFAMLHRVDPHMWVTFSAHLRCPWPRREHKILAGSTSGMMWDGRKIGAGSQPIKTKYGWLLITHGVDYAHVYRLGVMLLDLVNPSKLIYRSPNFILEPEKEFEVGKGADYWVPNVVFTCGALPHENHKEALGAEDELVVYYGAADTVMSIATAKVGALLTQEIRAGDLIP